MKVGDLRVVVNSNNPPDLGAGCRLYSANDGPKAADMANAERHQGRDDWRAISLTEAIEMAIGDAVSSALHSDNE